MRDEAGPVRTRRMLLALLIALLWGCSASPTSSPSGSADGPPAPTDFQAAAGAAAASPLRVFAASVDGPQKAGMRATADAACPSGMTLVAGGVNADLSTGKPPSPSIRLHGSLPRTAAGGSASGPGSASWAAVGATGGQDEAGGRTTGFAICAPASSGTQAGPVVAGWSSVVVASVPGPTKGGTATRATATCPKGTGLTGGGGDVTMKDGSDPPRYYFLAGGFPSTPRGVPVVPGATASSWTAVGAIGGMPLQGGEVTAFAVCTEGASTTVAVRTVRGPSEPRSAATATAICPPGRTLVGGGANTGLPRGGNPPQGLHLRGSFPSTPRGVASASDVAPQAWTAVGNAGGMLVLGASTSAFALCAA